MSTPSLALVRQGWGGLSEEGRRLLAPVGGFVLLLVVGLPLTFTYHLWPFVIAGVTDGSIYSLAVVGLVLTYKTTGVFNFAIGGQAAASAYVFYTFRDTEHLPWPVAGLLALLIVGLGGSLVLERVTSLLAEAPAIMRVVASIGLLVLLESVLTGVYGTATILFNGFLPSHAIRLGGVNVLASQIIVVAIALSATAGLYWFFKQARIGIAMQAVVDDPQLVGLQGTSPVTVRRYAWAIGSCFVSVSGMLVAPLLGIDVDQMLLLYIAAFGAAALGAFSSLPITFCSAIGIGIAMNVVQDRTAGFKDPVWAGFYTQIPFLVLIGAMILVPRRRLIDRGMRRVRKVRPTVRFPRSVVASGGAAGLGLAVALPYVVSRADISQYASGLGFAVILASLSLLIWTSGQISLCQMAFAAVGASSFAHFRHDGIPWLWALLLAAAVTVPVGAIVAIPSFRLTGTYLAVATFGFGLLFQNLIYNTFLMFGTNGSLAAPRPLLFGLHTSSDEGFYYVALLVTVLCFMAVLAVRRSRLGRLLRALSDSPVALDAHGANTRVTRLFVFCVSAFLAAIGGVLIAGASLGASGVSSGSFGYFNSMVLVAVLAFCGRRPLLSPVIASFVFEVLKLYDPFNRPFFVKYEGVFFGVLALAVAVGPALRVRGRWVDLAERRTASPVRARSEPESAVEVLTRMKVASR